MSFKSGTVQDYRYASTLLTTLGWDIVWQLDGLTEYVLRGPGTTGVPVYLGVRVIAIPASQTYGLQLFGMAGYNSGAVKLEDHVNVSPGKFLFLDTGPMNFWCTYSERRIIVTFQISTIFETMYAGLVRAFGTPVSDGTHGAYPYPYCLGASSGYVSVTNANWRSTDEPHSLLTSPRSQSSSPTSTCFLDPNSNWRQLVNRASFSGDYANACAMGPDGAGTDLNWGLTPNSTEIPGHIGYRGQLQTIGEGFGGVKQVIPCHIMDLASSACYGELDGIVAVPAKSGISALDVITVDGYDFGVFPNVFRTGFGDLFAQQLS